eukprot:79291_1
MANIDMHSSNARSLRNLRNILIVGYVRHYATYLPTKWFNVFNQYYGCYYYYSPSHIRPKIIEEELLIAGYIHHYNRHNMKRITILIRKYYGAKIANIHYGLHKYEWYSPKRSEIHFYVACIVQPSRIHHDLSKTENQSLQCGGLWAIRNLSRYEHNQHTTHCAKRLVEEGGIEALISLFRNARDEGTVGQAIWGLAYIAGEHKEYCDRIISTGVVPEVSSVLDCRMGFCRGIDRNSKWFLSNVFRYKNSLRLVNILVEPHHRKEEDVLPRRWVKRIVSVARKKTMERRLEACGCIVNVTADATMKQKKVLAEYGAIEALCSMFAPGIALIMTDESINGIIEGLGCLLEVYGTSIWNVYAQKIEECGGLDHLEEMNQNTKKYNTIIRKANTNNKFIVSGFIRKYYINNAWLIDCLVLWYRRCRWM